MSANDIKYLVLHCSASRCNEDYSVEQLRRDHKAGGLDEHGNPCNTMTPEQETRLIDLFRNLKILFPKA